MNIEQLKTDILILGSGGAGLFAACTPIGPIPISTSQL